MERAPIAIVRDRAFELADTGKFKFWPGVRDALAQEGGDNFLIRLLEGDAYFKFRLRQRIKAAQGRTGA